MISSKIKTETKGQDKVDNLLRVIERFPTAHVKIGFFEGESAGRYSGSNAPDVVEVAAWNEFGTPTSPARSFIGSTIDEHEAQIEKWRDEMVEGILFKGWTIEKGLEYMGFRIKTLIENKIKSNVPPPNAASTKEHKARSGVAPDTLIDTGLMLRSVTYKIYLT